MRMRLAFWWVSATATLVLPFGVVKAYSVIHDDGQCQCDSVEVVSTRPDVTEKHANLLGTYRRRPDKVNSRPSYQHHSGEFYLFYNDHSQGFWAVGEHLNTDVVRLENQGDSLCPYRMKSTWRFADGDLKALVYDDSLKVVCLEDVCSVAHCGQQAHCVGDANNNGTTTHCECLGGFFGDPYNRCYPADSGDVACGCQRLIFSSQNEVALAKHQNSYGEYFLYGYYGGSPVYQHFAGVEYLYSRDGNWLISDEVGLREAGLQNQGDPGAAYDCPYLFRTTWEYADIEQPGWQWVYDYTARLVCPAEPCSLTKCGFHAKCVEEKGQGVCQCEEGHEGNAYHRCHPKESPSPDCACRELSVSSLGASALAQADKMGAYYYYDTMNGRSAFQHRSGLDFLYFAEGNAWVIGAEFGGSRVGIVNFDRGTCPYRLKGKWKHSVGGKLQVDQSLTVECSDYQGHENEEKGTGQSTTAGNSTVEATTQPTITLPTTVNVNKSTYFPFATVTTSTTTGATTQVPAVEKRTDTTPYSPTTSPTSGDGSQNKTEIVLPANVNSTKVEEVDSGEGHNEEFEEEPLDLPCPCPEIVINSTHPPTLSKHGAQLGRYALYDHRAGRPVYRHVDREQYLYYHPYSGGNWLVNYEVGLLYGGIQNSKDLPVCPYLLNTAWQYGDSELGGWVYDPALRVTCPTDECSVLRCGFRAKCVHDAVSGGARCVCRKGFVGDPRIRCLPREVSPSCPCRHLTMSSRGRARDHQRDKMGEYFLWGYYNSRPVYQHYSGLDFLYFHKNNVWGVGPKVGGNSAGLLNFGTLPCPHRLKTPWEFGTKDRVMRRQVDPSLLLECVDEGVIPSQDSSVINTKSNATATASNICGSRAIIPDQDRLLHAGADKIVNYGSFPWHAQISVVDRDVGLRHLCSGVIVSHRQILTVASCLTTQPIFKYRILVGDHLSARRDEHERAFALQSVHLHEGYNGIGGDDDIALATVRQDPGHFEFGPFVAPICLPLPGLDYDKDLLCEVSSWDPTARDDALRATAIPVNRNCAAGAKEVCAGAFSSIFECHLDQGTPLVCPGRQGATLIGLLSVVPNCVEKPASNRFIRISEYSQWIQDRLEL